MTLMRMRHAAERARLMMEMEEREQQRLGRGGALAVLIEADLQRTPILHGGVEN
jgi:hypothetical protein